MGICMEKSFGMRSQFFGLGWVGQKKLVNACFEMCLWAYVLMYRRTERTRLRETLKQDAIYCSNAVYFISKVLEMQFLYSYDFEALICIYIMQNTCNIDLSISYIAS